MKAAAYLTEPVVAGGEITNRGTLIAEMREGGWSQAAIDRYLQGLDLHLSVRRSLDAVRGA